MAKIGLNSMTFNNDINILKNLKKDIDTYECTKPFLLQNYLKLLDIGIECQTFSSLIVNEYDLTNKNACILGTGGASRAAAVGLIERGITSIDFYTRNIINAQNAINYLRDKFPKINFTAHQIQNVLSLPKSAIVVNATPIGMKGYAMDEMPLSESVISQLDKDTLIYDIVYNPLTTLFLQTAQKHGLQVVEGLDMLLYQAQKAINIWTGKTPDFNEMKIAALRSL